MPTDEPLTSPDKPLTSPAILMISHDLVGPHMAGPGMRYWELARVLARHFPVTLAAPARSSPPAPDPALQLRAYRRGDAPSLRPIVEAADVLVAPGDSLLEFPFLLHCTQPMVMDGYDPHTFESLAWNAAGGDLDARLRSHRDRLRILDLQCAVGDFFICASERQRMLWLGWLEATGRVNPFTYDADPSLRSLVDVVPTGVPSRPPSHTCRLVRGVIPGIGPDDPLLVWGGGIWNWLDPLTLIHAVARAAQVRPQLRLYFPGPRHPYREFVPDMAMHHAARRLSEEAGLTDRNVFWGDWVPYADRQNYLLEADVGCSLHLDTAEATFAFRTRVLDYIWAGLPMVVTRGDATAELVQHYRLGRVVDYGDVAGVADAILDLLATPRHAFQDRFQAARSERSWEQNAQPLLRFCGDPLPAPDKRMSDTWRRARDALSESARHKDRIARQREEIAQLRQVIAGYERGRFIRLMRQLHRLRHRLGGRQ